MPPGIRALGCIGNVSFPAVELTTEHVLIEDEFNPRKSVGILGVVKTDNRLDVLQRYTVIIGDLLRRLAQLLISHNRAR